MNVNEFSGPQTQRLARSIAQAFQIQNGNHLIPILGDGSENDNVEALTTWIRQNLENPDFDVARRVLPLLTERLEHQLRVKD